MSARLRQFRKSPDRWLKNPLADDLVECIRHQHQNLERRRLDAMRMTDPGELIEFAENWERRRSDYEQQHDMAPRDPCLDAESWGNCVRRAHNWMSRTAVSRRRFVSGLSLSAVGMALAPIGAAFGQTTTISRITGILDLSPEIVDAGFTADLTALATELSADDVPVIVMLRNGINYSWPTGTPIPLGVSFVGMGYDNDRATPDNTLGTVIRDSGGSARLIQDTGPEDIQQFFLNVGMPNGFEIKKQRTLMMNCMTDGLGMLVGATGTAPYYTTILGHTFASDAGTGAGDLESCLMLDQQCNAVVFDGFFFVKDAARGIDTTGNSAPSGNKFQVTFDQSGTVNQIGALARFEEMNGSVVDVYRLELLAALAGADFLDGGHIIFDTNARDIRMDVDASANLSNGGVLRVSHVTTTAHNELTLPYDTRTIQGTAALYWDYRWPDYLAIREVEDIYIPPTTIRRSTLRCTNIDPDVVTFRQGFGVFGVAVATAGSADGTPGTYIYEYDDATGSPRNTVENQSVLIEVVIGGGGTLDSVRLLYQGWNLVAFPATASIDVGGQGTPGTVTLSDAPYGLWTTAQQTSVVAVKGVETAFAPDPISARWFMTPYP